jgi:hypothetical protein
MAPATWKHAKRDGQRVEARREASGRTHVTTPTKYDT